MQKSLIAITIFALTAVGSSACATKGFVKNQVGQVSSKVDTLSSSLEQTQERTRQNEARIGAVDQKAGAAQSAADSAGSSATAAGSAASAADQRAAAANASAMAAQQKADQVDKNAKRIVYEVVLSEDQGNFKTGTAVLPDQAKAKIDELMSSLMADPKGAYFEIEGHTDNVGDKAFNEKLGMDRADAVKKYLYDKFQVPLFRMNVISYGEDKPAAPNTTKEGRAQNRRVVIRVIA